MATSRSFQEFSKRLGILAKLVAKNAEEDVRGAALVADSTLVLRTPVDTGRARANWLPSIGIPDGRTLDETDPSGASAIERGRNLIGRWTLKDGPMYFSNSLPYAPRLDNGYSQQAPAGMTTFAISAARAYLRNAKLLRGQ